MAKPFNGAPEGPAPAQDYNQSVHDNPKHGVSRRSDAICAEHLKVSV